jgi:acyl-CoA thioester hydrolase
MRTDIEWRIAMRAPVKFKTNHRAKFSQIDPYGMVHNQYFLEYFMDHRMTGMREVCGWDLASLVKLPILFVVKSVNIDFLRPIKGDSAFTIDSYVVKIEGALCTVHCKMNGTDEKILAQCVMVVAAVDAKTMRATDTWPEEVVNKLFLSEDSVG